MSDIVDRLRAVDHLSVEDCYLQSHLFEQAAAEITRLRAQVERMREALTDAIDTVDFWAAYASDYFKDKHDLEGDLARLRAARAAMEG